MFFWKNKSKYLEKKKDEKKPLFWRAKVNPLRKNL